MEVGTEMTKRCVKPPRPSLLFAERRRWRVNRAAQLREGIGRKTRKAIVDTAEINPYPQHEDIMELSTGFGNGEKLRSKILA
jgi:hypothetical protein